MANRLTHNNVGHNPSSSYLFIEQGESYAGKRLSLVVIGEKTAPEKIKELRRCTALGISEEDSKYLVHFHVEIPRCSATSRGRSGIAATTSHVTLQALPNCHNPNGSRKQWAAGRFRSRDFLPRYNYSGGKSSAPGTHFTELEHVGTQQQSQRRQTKETDTEKAQCLEDAGPQTEESHVAQHHDLTTGQFVMLGDIGIFSLWACVRLQGVALSV